MSNPFTNLQSYAESVIEQHRIPAVSLALWHKGQCRQASAGILNIETGVQATPDSIFQIGSISKVFTACLVMQLVEQGRVELDKPVKHYLREFQIADPQATASITLRQLLNHTNGIAGDFFPDDIHAQGNAIARYLDRLNLISLVHPPGAKYSYSNAAFVVLGRLVEVQTGIRWRQAIAERIYQPLGMTHAVADPAETLRYRSAIGHFPDPQAPRQWRLSPKCYLTPALAPSGSTLMMSAGDLLSFGCAHLHRGKTDTGEQWLSPDSVRMMQTPTVELPAGSAVFDQHWGLGWGLMTDKRRGVTVVFHSGQSAGQNAVLRLFPEQDAAFAILLNGIRPGVTHTIANDLMKALVDIDGQEPEPCQVKLDATALQPYTGAFDSFDAVYRIALQEETSGSGQLNVIRTDKLHKTASRLTWLPLGDHVFAAYTDEGVRLPNVVYIADGHIAALEQLFVGSRLNRRISPPDAS